MNRLHDHFAWRFAHTLRLDGHRIATEVGIPDGRIDLVRLDEAGRWIELYEVKVRAPEAGFAQLAKYAEYLDEAPLRTLVVPPDLATDELRAAAKASDTQLHVFDHTLGVQLSLWERWNRWVDLPYIHPESLARADERRREWLRLEREALQAARANAGRAA